MLQIKEELTQEKKSQREKIREFERLQLSYQAYGLPPQVAGWLGYLFCAIKAFFPAQIFFEEERGMTGIVLMMYLWVVWGAYLYIMPYLQLKEQKTTVSVLQKIKYLPVDIREVKIVWLGYLWNYIKKLFWIALVAQLGAALLFYHNVTIWNLLDVLVITALPLLTNGLTICCSRYPKK